MKEKMASLSALLQDLADRISSKEAGSTTQLDDDDPVVVRFQHLLPSLLESYFIPSKVKERESTAILKLLNQTVSLYPAVLCHGKGHAVLPIMGRIIPLLSEPSRRASHDSLFATLCSLMSILRNGDTDIYVMLFSGALLLIEDILPVASYFSSVTSFTICTHVSLQCFVEAYETVYLSDDARKVPLWESPDGPGLSIDVTGYKRWLPFAVWTLRFISHCITEGPLLIEGLLSFPFIETVGMLLCYGHSHLHKAALEVLRLTTTLTGAHMFRSERLISSVLSLVSETSGVPVPFRDNGYDAGIGSCLTALYSSGSTEMIESTARNFVDVFLQATARNTSRDLRVAMCEVFGSVLKHCPSYFKYLAFLLHTASMPEMSQTWSFCLQLALDILGHEVVAGFPEEQVMHHRARVGLGNKATDKTVVSSHRNSLGVPFHVVTKSRPAGKVYENQCLKRRKAALGEPCLVDANVQTFEAHATAGTSCWPPPHNCTLEMGFTPDHASELDTKLVAQILHHKVFEVIGSLLPCPGVLDARNIDKKLLTLCTLARSFYGFPRTLWKHYLVKQTAKWIPWLQKMALDGSLMAVQLATFFEAIDKLFSEKGTCGGPYVQDGPVLSPESDLACFLEALDSSGCSLLNVLVLPWSIPHTDPELQNQMKCRALLFSVKVASQLKGFSCASLFELAYKDDDAAVRATAVKNLPRLAAWSGGHRFRETCRHFCSLRMDKADVVRKAVACNIGLVVCAYYTSQLDMGAQAGHCSTCPMWEEFVCPACNAGDCLSRRIGMSNSDLRSIEEGYIVGGQRCIFPLDMLQLLFSELLFGETSEHVQVAFIESLGRLLQHMTVTELQLTRAEWLKCLDVLPLHHQRAVREAFGLQVHGLVQEKVLEGMFGRSDDTTSSKELRLLRTFKYALNVTVDPDLLETLMETVAEIALAARHRRQMLVFSLVLIIEQVDNPNMSIQATSVRLLHKIAAVGWPARGSKGVHLMVECLQHELFQYLCGRIVTRPFMIKQVAEAVLSMDMSELLKRMIPVVLPHLILDMQRTPTTLDMLHELARLLETELPYLLVDFCHQVLSVLLLRADGSELLAALQFYETQTGSETREIFAAVLPALLDELVRFLGDVDSGDTSKRSARVAPMIKEVASIVTGSDDLPSFLRTHFVGLLNSIDRKLLKATDLASQIQALRCIQHLIDMIGLHLSAFVPKIMALLSRALQESSLQEDGLAVWLFFVRTLARVAPANLKNIASQIVVALMPCLEAHLEEETPHLTAVMSVLEELIITSGLILEDQIRELPLLPTHIKLAKVNAALHETKGLLSLRDQLQQAVDGLCHESLSVRYTTAKELIKWMQNKRKGIAGMILDENILDTGVVNSLTTALLHGCSEESRTGMSQRFRMACAECLGELGAVDPVKLQVNLHHRSKIEKSDEDLVFELINEHLAKMLRAASDTDVQDAAALAIQELLKFSGCRGDLLGGCTTSPSGPSKAKTKPFDSDVFESTKRTKRTLLMAQTSTESGEQLWRRFSDDVKEIITPCLTSKYHLRNPGTAMPAGPIFRSGISFRRWIYLWARRLVSQATGGRSDIFTACRGVLRHDMGTALYLLPYLVVNVICYGEIEARNNVTTEILAVLAEAGSSTAEAGSPSDVTVAKGLEGWSGPTEMSTQCVFTLLDKLGQWLDDSKIAVSHCQEAKSGGGIDDEGNAANLCLQHKHVSELLEAIPKQALAGASFRCQAYARALLYFESHVRATSGALNPSAHISGSFKGEDVTILLEIFSGLDEPDGLTGLSRLRKSVSLQDQILIHEKTGNWADALTCCEQALQLEPTSINRHSGVLNCLLNMGHLQAMVTHVDGLILRFPSNKREWCLRGVQAAWRLGQWDLLDEYVEGALVDGPLSLGAESNAAFDIWVAKMLQALQRQDQVVFQTNLVECREALLVPLAAASMESYARAYPIIVKLHMLKELEDFRVLTCKNDINDICRSANDNAILKTVEEWEDRLELTQKSLSAREPILALRRLLFQASKMPSEVGSCWLQYAKLCRTAGHYETASRAILEAQSAGAPNVHMEKAKLFWETQKSHRAILELQQAIPSAHIVRATTVAEGSCGVSGPETHLPSGAGANTRSVGTSKSVLMSQLRRDGDRDAAKMLLLLARWVHHTGQKHREEVLNLFSRVRELQPRWEKAFFYVAKYYDDLLVDARRRQEEGQDNNSGISGTANPRRKLSSGVIADDKPWWTYVPDAVLFYAKGLHRGHRRLFQALPRLLTLWFEFGSRYRGESLSSVKGVKAVHAKLLNVMRGCLKELPSYQWVTALSQLVSRICHPNEDMVKLVKLIITGVIGTHPQQALWTMAAVSKSTVQARREAGAEVLRQAANGESDKLLFIQFAGFIEQMIKLCFYGGDPKAKYISIAADFGILKRMMPVRVIMPVQQSLTVALPADGLTNPTFDPFAVTDNSTIHGIRDEVEVLASLQRPKKVVLLSSDGVEHPFLCKPKDDLRKDARMMEFTTMINRLLCKDSKSRRRKLYIRTFVVVPLTEESGMIEWVLHTRGLRHILQDLYVSAGLFDRKNTNPQIKKVYEQQGQIPGGEMLRTKILPMFPPIFHRWFLNTFPEPAAWFRARLAYAHTSAVWSMVGHILGLGDRHGENILFDSTTGDCVHVDFSCLFDKGLTLEKPELVPFRLTQNMVDGLGITGYEGTFLQICEITLSILRTHRETLMSVLEPFIHDPLVEWTKIHKSSGVEMQNPHAQRAIARIQARLQGVVVGVGAAPSLPLSVEGQAHRLITEAVSHENLEKMYIWWMAWF